MTLQKEMNQPSLIASLLLTLISLQRLHQKLFHLKRKLIKLLLLPRLVIKSLKKKVKLPPRLKRLIKQLHQKLKLQLLISKRNLNWELFLEEQAVVLKH